MRRLSCSSLRSAARFVAGLKARAARSTRAVYAQHETAFDIEDGGRVFRQSCANCHGPDGNEIPGIDLGRGAVQDREDRRGSRRHHPQGRARHANAGDEHVRGAGQEGGRLPPCDCRHQDQRNRGRRRGARQGDLRREGRLCELPPRERRRLAHRARPDAHRAVAALGRSRTLARRSGGGSAADGPLLSRRRQGRRHGHRTPAEHRHLYGPDDGHEGAAAVVHEERSEGARLHPVADAVVQSDVEHSGTRRRGRAIWCR